VLFTDVIMPKGMSGIDLAREVRSRHPHVKVVYASGYSRSVIASTAIVGEDVTLLRKPYGSEALAAAMRVAAPQHAEDKARRAG
jgi:DNA-binding NtrC family response regulator